MPKPHTMVQELEARELYGSHSVLSRIQYQQMGPLNSYTHGTAADAALEHRARNGNEFFSVEDSEELLGFAAMMGLFSAMGLEVLIEDDTRARQAAQRFARLKARPSYVFRQVPRADRGCM
jgi:hypothetical protein